MDFSDVRGQEATKRALTVALAGGHSITLIGPSGTGKTMLAQRAHKIAPKLRIEEYTIRCKSQTCPKCQEVLHDWREPLRALLHTDIHCEVPAVPYSELFGKKLGTDTATVQRHLEQCRLHRHWALSEGCLLLMKQFMAEMLPSARGAMTAVRVARTIANLAGQGKIGEDHLAEAIQYRLDREV